jgi:hypothetical protein
MKVKLADPKSKVGEKKDVGPALYTVYPDKVPYKIYTVIKEEPKPQISPEEMIVIKFTLADKFNNTFEGRNDIVDNNYLTLLNNDAPLTINSLSLEKKGKEEIYTIEVYPKYPPKTMVMNALYDDEENTAFCFEKDIEVEIKANI